MSDWTRIIPGLCSDLNILLLNSCLYLLSCLVDALTTIPILIFNGESLRYIVAESAQDAINKEIQACSRAKGKRYYSPAHAIEYSLKLTVSIFPGIYHPHQPHQSSTS